MTKHVIIIGAGTGGLALGHALQKSNADITFTIYERDRTRTDGLYGYRVGISPEGSRCLSECLPPDLYEVFKKTTAITPDYFNMLTEQLQELISIDGFSSKSDDGAGAEWSVSRMSLRQVLLTGLEDDVQFDKQFSRYEIGQDGKVTAFFQDGTQVTGDMLVGADGTGSHVRRQYLPDARLKETGLYGVTTKVELTEETRALLTPKMLRGVNMVMAPQGVSCIIHVMEFPWDRDGKVKKGDVGGNDDRLLQSWPGLNFDNTRDYIMLGMGFHGQQIPTDIMQMKGEALHEMVLERTADWHPNLCTLLNQVDPSTCFPINIRTTERQKPWESSVVTLIGDAIHTMTPGLGVGANTALLDAKILSENLIKAAAGDMDIVAAVGEYEQRMHTYAWDRVEKSLERFNADDAIYQPGWRGTLAMTFMRGSMRLVNAIPPLKKMMADSMTKERGERN